VWAGLENWALLVLVLALFLAYCVVAINDHDDD